MKHSQIKSNNQLSVQSILIWRIIQSLIWLIGLFIVFNLIFNPTLGIHLFWNILIPIAPLLLVVGVGIWRNVCPMASTALFARHMNFSKRRKLTMSQSSKLNLIAIIALFVIAPLRHAIFNTSGSATAILILTLAIIAIVTSFFFEWKSAWCSGLCPIHPVEKLYGLKNKLKLPNAHCIECSKCVTPCPDSTPKLNPHSVKKTMYHKIAGTLTVGAFPGFVWGWFQVPDYYEITSLEMLITIYKLPFYGLVFTLIMYLTLRRFLKNKILIETFSAAAISCYYWYRIPALFGFGVFPGDGMLIDLTGLFPLWGIQGIVYMFTLFFFGWIVFSKQNINSWVVRPSYANPKNKLQSKPAL